MLRPPEKIVPGITPFAGVCNQIGYHEELAAANQAIGARYIQIHPIRMGRKYWDMNGKRKFDFSEIDFEFATAEKYGLAVKFCLSPFGWDIRHFTKEEAAEMKKYGVDKHPMLEMRQSYKKSGWIPLPPDP